MVISMSENTHIVNHLTPSIDGKGIMMGRRAFTEDFAPAGALILKVLRSPHAYAKITSIDASEARNMPGVECVLTHEDFPRIAHTRAGQGYPEPSPHDKFALDHYVRYVGDEVAVIAAKDKLTAEQAMQTIKVDYEVRTPVLDFETAKGNDTLVHQEEDIKEMFPIGFNPKENLAAAYEMEVGNVEDSLKDCEVTLEHSFYTQAQSHVMMEPHSVNVQLDYQNRLVIYSSTQTPFHIRRIIASVLDIPLSKVRVIKPRVGGGFGGKQAIHGELLAAAVTLKTGKASSLIYTRKEVFEATYTRHPMRLDVKLGADRDGTLKAIDFYGLSDTGAYGEHALTVFMVTGSKVLPLYNKVDSVRFHGHVVYTNRTPAGAFRGYGAIQGNFALETAIDMLANKLEIDPADFRKKNMMLEGETSPIFKIMGEGTKGTAMTMESCKLDYCLKRGRELTKWSERYPRYDETDTTVKSVGMAIAMQGSGIPYIDMGAATIKLNDDGFYNLMVGATEIGQGSDTVLAQIAAEALSTTMDNVIIYSSDSDLTPFDVGAYASSTTYVSGNAVMNAAKKLRVMMVDKVAHLMNVSTDLITFDGKTFKSKDETLSLKDFSNRITYNEHQEQLTASDSYVGHKSPPPFMAGFCTVEVDKQTGEFKVLDYTSVVDCGVTINPKLAQGQVEGAIVQGLGMAAYEESHRTKNGRLIENDMMTYRIPTHKEAPHLTTEFADSHEESGPYGAKSVGEIGIDTPPAALSNAIYNATGVRITTLPITPEKILEGMKKKENDL